jgi:hypothetical protein
MNQNTLSRILVYFILMLVVLQSAYCFAMAHSFASIFRGAQNVRASDPLPGFVWRYVAYGCLWLGAGLAFLLSSVRIRRWFAPLSVVALFYGVTGYQHTAPFLLSWFGVFSGDIVALETASSAILCLLGVLIFIHWVADRRHL